VPPQPAFARAVGLVACNRINASFSTLAALPWMMVLIAWRRGSAALTGLPEQTFGT